MKSNFSRLRRGLILLCIALLCLYFLFTPTLSSGPLWQQLWETVLTRGLCSVIFFLTALELELAVLFPIGYKKRKSEVCFSPRSLLYCLPFLIVAVNNFPLIPLFSGQATVTASLPHLAVFGLGCLFIGVFEELAFRGVIFLAVLRRFGSSPKQIFLSIAATSAIFGLIHLVNLISGGNPAGVLLQVGYSFLIGGMCALALLKTGSIWVPVLLHGLYDFGGFLVETLGEGVIWTPASIALTAAVAVAVVGYAVWLLTKITPEEVRRCVA